MKKILSITIILVILLIIMGFSQKEIFSLKNEKKEYKKILKLDSATTLYTTFDTINYKTSINIIVPLSVALKLNIISIDDMINNMEIENIANDGGSIIYKVKSQNIKFSNKEFNLVKCNTLSNNKNIYIASKIDLSSLPCKN